MSVLDADERARGQRLVVQADRQRYLAAHALTRIVAGRYLVHDPATLRFYEQCRRCGGAHGKPQLVEPRCDLELSLSHSGDRVVVALVRGVQVGVDVEELKSFASDPLLADAVLAPAERAALEGLPEAGRSRGLLRYWVRKEAVLKATGDGLAMSPALIAVSPPDEPPRLLGGRVPTRPGLPVQLHDLDPGAACVGCVALLTDVPHRIVEYDGSSFLA